MSITCESITSDIRAYADSAVEQGKQAVGQLTTTVSTAAGELLAQAERAIHLDAVLAAAEPYLNQVKQYTALGEKWVGQVAATAESLTGIMIESVQDRFVKPVVSLAGGGATPVVTTAPRTAPRKSPARKAAATRPATKSATPGIARKAPVKKAPVKKSPAKKASS